MGWREKKKRARKPKEGGFTFLFVLGSAEGEALGFHTRLNLLDGVLFEGEEKNLYGVIIK